MSRVLEFFRVWGLRIYNAVIFYGSWFLCMHAGANDSFLQALAFTLGGLGIQLYFAHIRREACILICSAVVLAFLLEPLYTYLGIFSYKIPNNLSPWLPPWWILPVYAVYGSSIAYSLTWLENLPTLSCILGAAGGVSSYFAGIEMGAAEMTKPYYLPLVVIGAVWAFVVPFSFVYKRWLESWFLEESATDP